MEFDMKMKYISQDTFSLLLNIQYIYQRLKVCWWLYVDCRLDVTSFLHNNFQIVISENQISFVT